MDTQQLTERIGLLALNGYIDVYTAKQLVEIGAWNTIASILDYFDTMDKEAKRAYRLAAHFQEYGGQI